MTFITKNCWIYEFINYLLVYYFLRTNIQKYHMGKDIYVLEVRKKKWIDGRTNKWMNGKMNKWMDKWMEGGWMKCLIDKWTSKYKSRFNLSGFIGFAPVFYDVVTDTEIKDEDDDQLYYTNLYLDKKKRVSPNIIIFM